MVGRPLGSGGFAAGGVPLSFGVAERTGRGASVLRGADEVVGSALGALAVEGPASVAAGVAASVAGLAEVATIVVAVAMAGAALRASSSMDVPDPVACGASVKVSAAAATTTTAAPAPSAS